MQLQFPLTVHIVVVHYGSTVMLRIFQPISLYIKSSDTKKGKIEQLTTNQQW